MRASPKTFTRHQQSGATLMIALIMLVIVTLVAVTSFNIGDMNLKLVANAQDRQRARDIAERLLNERLHTISAGLTSNPCDILSLSSADGTMEDVIDEVSVTFSRTLIRAECVQNDAVRTPWLSGVETVASRLIEEAAACAEGVESAACSTAKENLKEAEAARGRAERRAKECLRKPQTTTNLVLNDPEATPEDEEAGSTGESTETEDDEANSNSYCVDVVMEIRAEAVDTLTNARASVTRGVALRCSNHDIPEC